MKTKAIKYTDNKEDDPRVAWRRAAVRLSKMSRVEEAQTLVTAGILDRKMRLKPAYKHLLAEAE
jgi:hypothetical protein